MKRILNKESRAAIELMIANNLITKDVAEKYFPELKESGNEKIRNFISNELACLRATDEKGSDRYEELTNAIAWLEKQKVLTTEENLQGKKDVLWCIKQAKKYAKDENEMGTCWFVEKWLEKQGEQKSAWSEEDEEMLKDTIRFCELYGDKISVNWLKSLKERYTWKPSEEQLKLLQEVIDVGHYISYPNALETLYEQFKQF